MPLLDEALNAKAPDLVYEFTNVKTGKSDNKIVSMFYPAGLANFPGMGWRFGAGADKSEVLAFLPIIVRNNTIMAAIIFRVRCYRCHRRGRNDFQAYY